MRRWLLVLCGCNQTFGINANYVDRDARYFDVMPDAQPLCPATGQLPRFSPSIHQLIDRACVGYTIGSGRAMALCDSGIVEEGMVGGDLAPAPGMPSLDIANPSNQVWIAPEGDAAIVDEVDKVTGLLSHTAWRRKSGTWSQDATIPTPGNGTLSTPTREPRHLLYQNYDATVTELIQTGATTWTQKVVTLDASEEVHQSWLSPDGLRAVLLSKGGSGLHLLYIDRATIDADFNPAKELPSLPNVGDLFITEDCTRAYMSSVRSVFYAVEI